MAKAPTEPSEKQFPSWLSFVLSRRRPCIKRRRSLDLYCIWLLQCCEQGSRCLHCCCTEHIARASQPCASTSEESATIHEGYPGPITTMSRSKETAWNLVPGLPDPDLSLRVRAAAQQPWSQVAGQERPVAGRAAVNRWILRVASGLAWSVLVWFGQQRFCRWPVAGRNALKIEVEDVPQLGGAWR